MAEITTAITSNWGPNFECVNDISKVTFLFVVITMERVEECALEMATTITTIIQVEVAEEVEVVEAAEEVEEIITTTIIITTITTTEEENEVIISISKKLFLVH